MRLRNVRDPETREWSWLLQQRRYAEIDDLRYLKIGEIHLNEAEHAAFEAFEGNEIRKNRYFHEFDGNEFAIDMFLGELWGLNIASVELPDARSFADLEPPSFAVFEVTNDPFFLGENLVKKTFVDVQARVADLAAGDSEAARAAEKELM